MSNKNKIEQKLFNQTDTARMLGVSVETLRRWRWKKYIGFVQINNTIMFSKEQIDEFIEKSTIDNG